MSDEDKGQHSEDFVDKMEKAVDRVEEAAQDSFIDHAVLMFTSTDQEGTTYTLYRTIGNQHAQMGMAQQWLSSRDEDLRVYRRKRGTRESE
ncbi:hypothetical protein UFOVP329_21 [uncultured Caudovirales phage]|uniref:Uncharacterized protein n=1 Tax=uncultured Caudovirales phage TaxID=2100421 RepID=A0A6J5M2W3_9CAUD|nr:hypothetical protein UFOVP329_21 [uncultured Caudovirales phage]